MTIEYVNLSGRRNSIKLFPASNHIRWLNGEEMNRDGSLNVDLLAAEPCNSVGSPRKFYFLGL